MFNFSAAQRLKYFLELTIIKDKNRQMVLITVTGFHVVFAQKTIIDIDKRFFASLSTTFFDNLNSENSEIYDSRVFRPYSGSTISGIV